MFISKLFKKNVIYFSFPPPYESVRRLKAKVKHARESVASYEKLSSPERQKRKNVKNIIRCTPFNEIFIGLIVPTGLWNCPATHFCTQHMQLLQ
jgi:hypothetical protein